MFNKNEIKIQRGDIFYADLDPVYGSEQGGKRPVVVIQNDRGNFHSPTIITAATTSNSDKPWIPTHVLLKKRYDNRLKTDSIVLLEQIRTIDRNRLGSYIGSLNTEELERLDEALSVSIGLKSKI